MAQKPSSEGGSTVGDGHQGIAGNQGGSPSLASYLQDSTPGPMRLRVSIPTASAPTPVFAFDSGQAPGLSELHHVGDAPGRSS
jgi:hypothetical protein